jgi:RND family efflux transporter MFP subunit
MHRREKVLLRASAVLFSLAAIPAWPQDWVRGITEPYRDVTLTSPVAGIVVGIPHEEGQRVRQGDTVLELERDLEELEVERRRLIAESKAELTAAQRRAETLALDLEATRRIYASTRSVSQEELRQKELEHELARAELERLKVAEDREQVEYRIAVAQLQKRLVLAPFDGVVVKVLPEKGETIHPQQPLARIADVSRCRLIVYVPAAAAARVGAGDRAALRIDGAASQIAGTIEFVSPVVDPSSGMREVKVLFENPNGSVSPGVSGSLLLR